MDEQPAAAAEISDPHLEALVASIDAELAEPAPGGAAASGAPAAIPLERELAGMFAMLGAGAGQFFPSAKTVLEERTCKQLGDVLAPLARKYGLDRYLAGFQWRLELQALFVVVPVAIALRQAIAHDVAEYRKAAAAGAGAGLGEATPAGAAPVEKLEPVAS